MCVCSVAQACPTLYNLMDCSLSVSSVHGIFQARRLEWGAISFSRGSYWPGVKPASLASPALAGEFFTARATWGAYTIITETPIFSPSPQLLWSPGSATVGFVFPFSYMKWPGYWMNSLYLPKFGGTSLDGNLQKIIIPIEFTKKFLSQLNLLKSLITSVYLPCWQIS